MMIGSTGKPDAASASDGADLTYLVGATLAAIDEHPDPNWWVNADNTAYTPAAERWFREHLAGHPLGDLEDLAGRLLRTAPLSMEEADAAHLIRAWVCEARSAALPDSDRAPEQLRRDYFIAEYFERRRAAKLRNHADKLMRLIAEVPGEDEEANEDRWLIFGDALALNQAADVCDAQADRLQAAAEECRDWSDARILRFANRHYRYHKRSSLVERHVRRRLRHGRGAWALRSPRRRRGPGVEMPAPRLRQGRRPNARRAAVRRASGIRSGTDPGGDEPPAAHRLLALVALVLLALVLPSHMSTTDLNTSTKTLTFTGTWTDVEVDVDGRYGITWVGSDAAGLEKRIEKQRASLAAVLRLRDHHRQLQREYEIAYKKAFKSGEDFGHLVAPAKEHQRRANQLDAKARSIVLELDRLLAELARAAEEPDHDIVVRVDLAPARRPTLLVSGSRRESHGCRPGHRRVRRSEPPPGDSDGGSSPPCLTAGPHPDDHSFAGVIA